MTVCPFAHSRRTMWKVYVDVLAALVKHRVLADGDCCLVVAHDADGHLALVDQRGQVDLDEILIAQTAEVRGSQITTPEVG